jgi:hypothetical protein
MYGKRPVARGVAGCWQAAGRYQSHESENVTDLCGPAAAAAAIISSDKKESIRPPGWAAGPTVPPI